MSDCWLYPYGDVYYCFSHIDEANSIIDEYGLGEKFNESRYFPNVESFWIEGVDKIFN